MRKAGPQRSVETSAAIPGRQPAHETEAGRRIFLAGCTKYGGSGSISEAEGASPAAPTTPAGRLHYATLRLLAAPTSASSASALRPDGTIARRARSSRATFIDGAVIARSQNPSEV